MNRSAPRSERAPPERVAAAAGCGTRTLGGNQGTGATGEIEPPSAWNKAAVSA
jgi:hypothetical protein